MLIKANDYVNKTILDVLRAKGVNISAPCGGKGTCGKCAVLVKKPGQQPITVLACETYVTDDVDVELINSDDGFEILTGYSGGGIGSDFCFSVIEIKRSDIKRSISEYINFNNGLEIPLRIIREFSGLINQNVNNFYESETLFVLTDEKRIAGVYLNETINAYGVAVDIGTTTVGMQLVGLLDGKIIKSHSLLNSQRKFGADVISRIQNSTGDNFFELTRLIREDIKAGIKELISSAGISAADIHKAAISGNTTMIQFFLGIRSDSHGHTPFTSTLTSLCEFKFEEIFDDRLLDCNVTIMPGISAFIGSDIVSGLLLCGAAETFMLVDIGTNGEMALVTDDKIICTSTAAGPAFEGGNISCGTGSVAGAVSGISYENGEFNIKTISNAPPSGICGTGAIDLLATLLENGLLDETGILDDDFDGEVIIAPGITFTQKDVREMQLAKSALRSGIECLLNAAGLNGGDLGRVYIAGGFGFKLNLESAVKIGMIPGEFKDKVTIIGNSSLGGCVKTLLERGAAARAVEISAKCREINLSEDRLFNQLFMEHMYF